MVNSFNLIHTPKIFFGTGKVDLLFGILKKTGMNVLVITGSASYLQNTNVMKLLFKLEKEGFILHIDKIATEPSPGEVNRIVERFRSVELNAVLAVGGGSVIDAGKAVSAMLPLEGSVLDYLEGIGGKSHPGLKKFFVAIPTTSGTGSETTANAVLSVTGTNGFKRSLRQENLVPDIAIVDPALTLSCPPEITASSGMDAFTQLTESYLSVKSGWLTDTLALDGIRKVRDCLINAVTRGEDIEARAGMSYAALLSGITLANAGLGLIHGFASSVGGLFNIPHGVICGTMMGVVNRSNIESLIKEKSNITAVNKYVRLGELLSGENGMATEWYMKYVADYIDELTEKLHIKALGIYGITINDLQNIAEITDHKNNPVQFDTSVLIEMLKSRL
jgi:alcohol dehydrogenase class IV